MLIRRCDKCGKEINTESYFCCDIYTAPVVFGNKNLTSYDLCYKCRDELIKCIQKED